MHIPQKMPQNTPQQKSEVINILKEWASPVLIGMVGMLLWRDVTELRSDVKQLLTQQSANQVRIERVEADIHLLKSISYKDAENYIKSESSPMKKEDEELNVTE